MRDLFSVRRAIMAGKASKRRYLVGRRITLARKHAGERDGSEISIGELARRLEMFPLRLWEIEQGIVAIDAIELSLIADALNVHSGWFYDQRSWREWEVIDQLNGLNLMAAKSIDELDFESRQLMIGLISKLAAAPMNCEPFAGR